MIVTQEKTDSRDRVLCVLTTGQAWQFKPYKWQDAKILFRHGELTRLLTLMICVA